MLSSVEYIRDRDDDLVRLRDEPSNHLQKEQWQENKELYKKYKMNKLESSALNHFKFKKL